MSAREWRRGKGQTLSGGGRSPACMTQTPKCLAHSPKFTDPSPYSRDTAFPPCQLISSSASPADLSPGTQWCSFPPSSFPRKVRAIIVKRDIVNSVPSATPRLRAEKFVFSAREKNNIYLMDAEQKVFTFHASGLKPILDQEGAFPGSETVRLGKCLALITLCPHPGTVQGQGLPPYPSAPKFLETMVYKAPLQLPLQT